MVQEELSSFHSPSDVKKVYFNLSKSVRGQRWAIVDQQAHTSICLFAVGLPWWEWAADVKLPVVDQCHAGPLAFRRFLPRASGLISGRVRLLVFRVALLRAHSDIRNIRTWHCRDHPGRPDPDLGTHLRVVLQTPLDGIICKVQCPLDIQTSLRH